MTSSIKNRLKYRNRGSFLLTIYLATWFGYSVTAQAGEPFGGRTRYTRPTLLPPAVNDTPDGAENPSISGDGLTIYYDGYSDTSKLPGIWQATRSSIGAEWVNGQPLGDAVNSSVRQLEADVTADGLELYFRASDHSEHYDTLLPSDSLMVATRSSIEDDWGEATRLPETIKPLACIQGPSVTGDGLELYFNAVDAPGNECRGGRFGNIYVTKRATRNDAWEEPQLVESFAVTSGISSDGLTLYFNGGDNASRRSAGLAVNTFDNGPSVFVRRRNSRDEDFGPAVELGDPPNTSSTFFAAWGPEPSSDGKTLYFSSDRPGAPSEFAIWQATVADPCDLNGDGSCNTDDLARRSLFRVDLTKGSDRDQHLSSYDISGDGLVNQADLDTWLSSAATTNGFTSSYVAGDTNLDGEVAFDDFLALADGFGGSSRDWAAGNFNGDADVDFADFLALSQHFGTQVPQKGAATVPEPACRSLLVASGILVMFSRRESRS